MAHLILQAQVPFYYSIPAMMTYQEMQSRLSRSHSADQKWRSEDLDEHGELYIIGFVLCCKLTDCIQLLENPSILKSRVVEDVMQVVGMPM